MSSVVDERRRFARERLGQFCSAVREARGWYQRDVVAHVSPVTDRPYISRRTYQAIEHPTPPYTKLEPSSLRGTELALELRPGTLTEVMALDAATFEAVMAPDSAHALAPRLLAFYRPTMDAEGRIAVVTSPDGFTDAQRQQAAGRIADASPKVTA